MESVIDKPKYNFFSNIRLREEPVKSIVKKCECEKHGFYDADFDAYSDGSEYQVSFCPLCEKEQEEKDNQERIAAEKIANENYCKSCNIEPEYFNKSLEDYIPNSESQEMAKNAVKKMLNGEVKKIVLLGGNGTGKTMLGSILAKKLHGKIYSMYEISTMIRQSYTMKAEKSELEIVNELASIPFLAIDEMGRTKGSSSEMNWLSFILDKRHVRRLPFMIMTNGHLRRDCKDGGCEKCFENYMDRDVISRLRQDSVLINVAGKDFRMNK